MNARVPPNEVRDRDDHIEIASRFDESWTSYDPADGDALRVILPQLGLRFDDVGVNIARSLDYTKAQVYTVPRPPMAADRLVITTRDTPVWAESVSWDIFDEVGMAKVIANYSDDLPRADVRARRMSAPVQTIGDSYGYNTQELRAAAQNRANLPIRRGVAARNAIDRKHNHLKVRGEAVFGMYGLTTHPNIPAVTPGTGDWAGDATGDQIVADASALLNAIINQSNGIHTPNVLGMDIQRRQQAATKRIAGGQQETALEIIQRQFPGVEIVTVQELKGAGAGGTNMLIAGERDIDNYYYDEVMALVQHPPQARGLEFIVPCESRTAGLIVVQPLSLATMTGV